MTAPHDWELALDVLEEWVRRTLDALGTKDLDVPSAPPSLPATPVPAELRLRAQVVLDRLHSTESEGLRRRTQLVQAQAYSS